VPRRQEPIGQNREGLPARRTDSAPHPETLIPVIVALTEALSMADDRVLSANWTSPRKEVQWDHPPIDVVFQLWQCDKENHDWLEGPPLTVAC